MTALEKRLTGLANDFDTCQGESGTVLCPITADAVADLRALLAAHKEAKRELGRIRKLARMSGVDKHWWKVGGVKI